MVCPPLVVIVFMSVVSAIFLFWSALVKLSAHPPMSRCSDHGAHIRDRTRMPITEQGMCAKRLHRELNTLIKHSHSHQLGSCKSSSIDAKMKLRNITDSLLKWRILILLQTIQINTASNQQHRGAGPSLDLSKLRKTELCRPEPGHLPSYLTSYLYTILASSSYL